VGKQTIYRWRPSRGAVVLEAATESTDAAVALPDTGDLVADLRTQLTGIVEVVATTGFGAAYRGLMAAGQSDPDLLRTVFEQITEINITGFNVRTALAIERSDRAQTHRRHSRDRVPRCSLAVVCSGGAVYEPKKRPLTPIFVGALGFLDLVIE
jgi:hypothetical protein